MTANRPTLAERFPAGNIEHPEIVSRAEWLAARRELLRKEKQHTHAADRLAIERRALPWVKVEKKYTFEGPQGELS